MASTSDEASMETDGIQPSESQERDLLDLDNDIFIQPKARVIETHWKKWTETDKIYLTEHVKYHMACDDFYNKCLKRGPSTEGPAKNPTSSIENFLKSK